MEVRIVSVMPAGLGPMEDLVYNAPLVNTKALQALIPATFVRLVNIQLTRAPYPVAFVMIALLDHRLQSLMFLPLAIVNAILDLLALMANYVQVVFLVNIKTLLDPELVRFATMAHIQTHRQARV